MIKAPTFCVNIPLWRLCQQASGETHTISRWSIYSTSPIIINCKIIMWRRKGYRIWNISDNVSFNMKNLEACHRSHVTGVCRRCTWPGSTWSSCTSSPLPSSPSSTSWSTCPWPWSYLWPKLCHISFPLHCCTWVWCSREIRKATAIRNSLSRSQKREIGESPRYSGQKYKFMQIELAP